MRKRLLCLVLTACLIVGLLPLTASATESVPVSGRDIEIGDYITLGTYYGEPIVWRCVDIDENGPLMLSDKIIAIKAFDASGSYAGENGDNSHSRGNSYAHKRTNRGSNLWVDSNIRAWLNSTASAGNVAFPCGNLPQKDYLHGSVNAYAEESGFLSSDNFTAEELSCIKPVTQKTAVNEVDAQFATSGSEAFQYVTSVQSCAANYDTAYTVETTDRIFFLNCEQLEKVYENLGDYYLTRPTQAAVENSEYKSDSLAADKIWFYWLRDANGDSRSPTHVRHVSTDGNVYFSWAYDDIHLGIRPAFYLNVNANAFQFGRDNLSFINNYLDFFSISEALVWESEDAKEHGQGYILRGFAEMLKNDLGIWPGYQISIEAFCKLTNGMSNTVCNRIKSDKDRLWSGSCYGMAQVIAIRYLAPERLPLSEIDSSLTDDNSTYDLQAPKTSAATENLINYYQLSRLLPMSYVLADACSCEIANDYTKSLESVISTIKSGVPVPVGMSRYEQTDDGEKFEGGHAVVLLEIWDEQDDYYIVKVCDPNCTEYTTMYIYKHTDLTKNAFKIAYTSSQNVNTETITYNAITSYYPSLQEMDLRNYFGLDDNAGIFTDYDRAHLIAKTDASVSFTCGDVELQYEDGAVHYSSNISNPYISASTTSDGKNSSEVEFLFDKPSKDSVSSLSVSSETSYVDTTLILDGWSAAIRSENAISVQANSQNQSVSIQSEDAGMISLLLTRNETAEDWPWYGIAVDVDDATELTVTPTDAGIQISSDNLDGAAVAGQSDDNVDSLTLDTESQTVLLVNKTSSDSDNNYIDIIAKDVTVTFDPNGGTVTPVSAVTGEDGTLSSLPVPTRDGYIFNGWYSAPSGGNKITTSTVFATNTTVYAQWSKDTSGSSSSGSGNSTTNIYTISTSATENGSVSVSPKTARAGTTVIITATPDDGYELDKLTVTDKNGNSIKLTDQGNGKYTFTMPTSKVNVAASFISLEAPAPALPFTDVTTSDWFYDAVAYVYDSSLMTGTSATTFAPKATTTRGMIVTILHRLEGSPAAEASGFADVESGAWYQEAVDWAAANGIVNGTSQTTFAPTSPITREQMAAILYRYAAYKGYDVSQLADLSRFSDSSAVNTYAADALAWANAAGLITGVTDTTLSPQGSAVRAQAATILMRFCENIAQ